MAKTEAKRNPAVLDALNRVFAATYGLYFKTQVYHWNVVGADFQELHETFGDQYEELAEAVDELAERVRQLGQPTVLALSEVAKQSTVPEDKSVPKADEMLKNLLAGHEVVIALAKAGVDAANKAEDYATADLLTERLRSHEKTAWMLRSQIE